MKPISLRGHERSVTQIRYNREGDLLFSAGKDSTPCVWYSINGERLGTFGGVTGQEGHTGAVWCLDVDWQTKYFISGAADNTIRLWDVSTGKQVEKIETKSAVRSCAFSFGGNLIAYTTDKLMGQPCVMNIVDAREFKDNKIVQSLAIDSSAPKVTATVFGMLDMDLITGHDNGDLCLWDIRKNFASKTLVHDHGKSISDIQISTDKSMFISSSKDTTAKLFDAASLECLKTYKTDRPVNSASISSKFDHVVLGGGQEAMDVTTTSTRIGKFDARFFHLIFEEEFGRIKGHFGPINSVQYHPDGKGYASGAEDGYVRLHQFDLSYYEYLFEY